MAESIQTLVCPYLINEQQKYTMLRSEPHLFMFHSVKNTQVRFRCVIFIHTKKRSKKYITKMILDTPKIWILIISNDSFLPVILSQMYHTNFVSDGY